ncbi:hypothetical protein A1O7_03765 [Cladophialophora yegresii CBS 114405]|uniref:Beta-glucuronidase C-terminal domain-containing protein n=1 Tax=Cladophialophora yegresii CBS 114405 TaxID=1182544 RepID=W9WME9_9EURO|nr:uncharacterized protein A1O7_03765 [Cladophialophora yegresii CBS 114405]EXJ59619.1 hypothetical protein A1O7_03765 [Cladophialophora yegresii CBS 114405]
MQSLTPMFTLTTLFAVLAAVQAVPAPRRAAAVVPLTLTLDNSSINFDVAQTAEAAQPLDPQLISLSIEFGNAIDFFGDVGKPNEFSRKLLQNVVDRSGIPPVVRLGGNTQDKWVYCDNCTAALSSIVEVNPNHPMSSEAVNVTVGKAFFQALEENVPPATKFILGLNLGHNIYEIAQAEVDASLKYFNQSRILAYELGNEPNVYGGYPPVPARWRPSTWTVVDYAQQMLSWIPRLRARAKTNPPSFQFGSMIGPPTPFQDFSLTTLARMGVPQNIGGVKYFASHGYPENVCTKEASDQVQLTNYVNHLETVGFVSQYQGEIAAAKSAGAIFHIGETNSVACHGKDGVSNTLGALLWEIDYALTAAAAGVDRLFFHSGVGGFYYAMWEPLPVNSTTPAHINPTYYSMLFVADLVADLSQPTISRIVKLDTFDMAQYAIYEENRLQKLVILNTHYYNDTSETRPSKFVNVSSVLGPNIKFRRLTGSETTARSGVTWAGQSVDASGNIVGRLITEHASNGLIQLLASEAVIVERNGTSSS